MAFGIVLVLALFGLWCVSVVALVLGCLYVASRHPKDSLEEAYEMFESALRHPAGKGRKRATERGESP